MAFKEDLTTDMKETFLSPIEFGETGTLIRSGREVSLNVLYDEVLLKSDDIGASIDAISHNPRLFVSRNDLPNGKPCKGDVFVLKGSEFHEAKKLIAKDFEHAKDGCVVYYLKECK